ncbi:hypothetical protein CDAR_500861 [Caerostris darwini]|uniref:Uncharacterized protein n=1 Tax=Caerostris darwini TaxID=1538125 RepID=A0AAV4NJ94_9ARAC|nr:hypothetical protein CDAR_500861 [Caerostris darwini]
MSFGSQQKRAIGKSHLDTTNCILSRRRDDFISPARCLLVLLSSILFLSLCLSESKAHLSGGAKLSLIKFVRNHFGGVKWTNYFAIVFCGAEGS